MFENQQISQSNNQTGNLANNQSFPPQATNPLGSNKIAEDIFADVDKTSTRSVVRPSQPTTIQSQPVDGASQQSVIPSSQPANINTNNSIQEKQVPNSTSLSTPKTLLNKPTGQLDLEESLSIEQPSDRKGSFKYLLIGLVTLVVILSVGIFLYKKVLKPRFEKNNSSLKQDNNEIVEKNDYLQENNTINEDNSKNSDLLTKDEVLESLDSEKKLDKSDHTQESDNGNILNNKTKEINEEKLNNNEPVAFQEDADSDGDGLTDIEEQRLGTNRLLVDTDDDGLSDKEEVNIYKTNPLDPDTDGDTYLDGMEIKGGYNPNGQGKLLIKEL